MMRAGLVQLSVSDDPVANLPQTIERVREAVEAGSDFILTPECTNLISANRAHQRQVIRHEQDDPTLAALRNEARSGKVWLLIGSLCLLSDDESGDGRFANRSFVIGPDGGIVSRYDKIHMFDVTITETEVYRESAAYRPGTRAIVAKTPFARIGMSICYDLRFPNLYRHLAQNGAEILTVPAAFNHITGPAHWESLLRARAIETGCFVLAPAQTGFHPETTGKGRHTHGRSLAISPWGQILCDGGVEPGVSIVDIDLGEVILARQKIPSLSHDQSFETS